MLFKTLIFFFLYTLSALGQVTPKQGVFQKSLFKKGRSWIWSYYEKGDLSKLYSQEKYKIVKKNKNLVTFVLSSKVGDETVFSKRHKFQVNLKTCQNKFRHRHYNPSFIVHFWVRENNKWNYLGRTGKSLLFEEKFNCNPFLAEADVYDHPLRGPVLTVGPTKEGSYFFKEGELKGTLSHKHFNKGTPFHYLALLESP
ncbi:MAG: hypothetical protein VYD54_07220 [Bdellovibrionota bacterium]|nr:hypothetical protein [Bdellovibrionota bacterium]